MSRSLYIWQWANGTSAAGPQLSLYVSLRVPTIPTYSFVMVSKVLSPRPSVFDKLPPELCEHIFSFACLDDGYTGRSLSLVSRYISETSKPVRFQSLVVRNLPQAQALASILEKASLLHRRVRYLFVVCNYQQMYTSAIIHGDRQQMKNPTPSRFRWITSRLRLRPKQIARQTAWDVVLRTSVRDGNSFSPTIEEMMRLALIRILNAAAQHLQTLSLSIQTPRANVTLHGSSPLPCLRELTIAYGCEYYPKVPTRMLDTFQPLPALRRLNLVRFECGCGPLAVVGQIQRLAPSLTHVRLPCAVTGWNRRLDMGPSLQPAPEGQRLRPHLPSTVKKIFIQPPPPPSVPGPAQDYYEETLKECRALAMWDDLLVLEKPDQVAWNFDVKEMEKQWLDRINGGDGCWSTKNVMAP